MGHLGILLHDVQDSSQVAAHFCAGASRAVVTGISTVEQEATAKSSLLLPATLNRKVNAFNNTSMESVT